MATFASGEGYITAELVGACMPSIALWIKQWLCHHLVNLLLGIYHDVCKLRNARQHAAEHLHVLTHLMSLHNQVTRLFRQRFPPTCTELRHASNCCAHA